MSTFQYNQDFTSDFESNKSFHIDKYDSKSYDNIEKTLDEILTSGDNDKVIKEYITKYIPEEETRFTYNFRCSTNTIVKLNKKFILSQQNINANADNDDNEINKVKLEKLLFNSVKNYSGVIENRNKQLKQRYIILQEKILKNNIRRNAQAKQQQMFAFFNRLTYLGVISGVSIFCIKVILISNLTNPATWIGLLSNIYANPLNFQFLVDTLSTLQIFTAPEILTLKDLFSKVQFLIKDTELFKNKEYVKTLIDCIFNPTTENNKILETLGENENFKDHDKYPQLMQFFKYIKSVTDGKKLFTEKNDPSENKPIWEKNLVNELFTFYSSPLGNTALTSLKLATDSYGYFSQSADFFSKYKDADPNLLFKGIAVNSTSSLSFNVYSKIFTQSILNKIIGDKASSLILEIPVFGQLDLNTFFVTTVDSFLNVQVKSTIQGYFIKLEKEAGYDPEKEKAEKEKEKANSVEAVTENIIKRGQHIQKYEKLGYSNEQIAKLLDKPKRPNEYKFILSRYMKDFYNTFLDVVDDPYVTLELFTNVSFVFNLIQNNFYSILMGGGTYYLPQMVLTGFAHKSFLDLGKLTGGLLPTSIIPMNIITAYFRFKYGNDTIINREFELLKYNVINDVFSDVQTLINEMQSVFFDTSLGMSINRYLEALNDTIIGKLFKISCKLTQFFVNFAVVPTIKNKLINFLPNIKFPIIETLENKEKSERLFTFLDNKIANLIRGFNLNRANQLDIEELIKQISKDFSEFKDISKIIEGTIIPYLNAEGFFEWASKLKGPLDGAIIKFIKKPDDVSTKEGVEEKKQAYSGDILNEEQQKDDSRVESIKIVLGTDETGYGDFKVIDTNDIKSVLSKVYASDVKFDPRSKPTGFWSGLFETTSEEIQRSWGKNIYKDKLTQKGFTDEDIDILLKDKILISEIEATMNEEDPQTHKKPTVEQIMASIKLSDSLNFKTGKLMSDEKSNIINDYSMSNIYYYYYYKLFINEQLEIRRQEREKRKQEREQKELDDIKALEVGSTVLFDNEQGKIKYAVIEKINEDGTFDIKVTGDGTIWKNDGIIRKGISKDFLMPKDKDSKLRVRGISLSKQQLHKKYKEEEEAEIAVDEKTLSEEDDFDKFSKFLLDKFNVIEVAKRTNKPYNKIEHGILTDMITSLKTREGVTHKNWIYDNKGDVIKSYLINREGIDYLDGFFARLYNGSYDNPENKDYQIPTQILHKADLLKTADYDAYFGVNLQHRFGYSPQIVDGKKFLNSIELLIALNSDTTETESLSSMISDLEKRAASDINIQYSLDTLNTLYVSPISSIIKYYEGFVEYFKDLFCNVKSGGCNKENMVFFRHLNFNYSGFYDKMKNILSSGKLLEQIDKLMENDCIIQFFENNVETKHTCSVDGKTIYLNNNNINMDTGERIDNCVNKKVIDYKNKEEFLRILLRPETIFQLTKIKNLPKDEYNKIKSDSTPKKLSNLYGLAASKEKLKEYDEFFTLFNSFGEDGIKLTTQTTNISIFNIICAVIDSQEKDLDTKTLNGEEIDPIEKYKLNLLFKFKKILNDQTKGYTDPDIKNSYIDYFTQNGDILDNESFLNKRKIELQKLLDEIKKNCKDNNINESKTLFQKLKKEYFDKDVIGSINLNGIILRKNDINFQDVNSGALSSKLNDYNNFEIAPETGFSSKQNALKILLEHNLNSKDLGELCQDSGLEFIESYVDQRNIWYDKQSEIFKLYVLHNTNTVFSDLVTKYDKFKNDIREVIDDYSKNLSIIWTNSKPKDSDVTSTPPPLTGIAGKEETEKERKEMDAEVKRGNAAELSANVERNKTAKAQAEKETQTLTQDQKTDEKIDETTAQANKESLDSQLKYGSSANPNYFGNLLAELSKMSPSTLYTDTFTTTVNIDEKIKDKVEENKKITDASAECARQSSNWFINYNPNEKGPEKYTATTMGDLTETELNSYGCQTTNIMYEAAMNINYFIIQFGKIVLPIIQGVEKIICKLVSPSPDAGDASPAGGVFSALTSSPWCTLTRLILKMAQIYSKCFIYIFHDIMINKFSEKEMFEKLTSNDKPNLSDKLVFGLWSQMVNTLKGAESKVGINDRNDDMLCSNTLPLIGVQDISTLESNAYTLIDSIGKEISDNNFNMVNHANSPTLNNFPGYIDAGLREADGINYSNYAEVALKAGTSFLSKDELETYDKLMKTITDKKPSITCDDLYPRFNNITALKLSINSLLFNPTNNFFFTNLKCRLFGTSKPDTENQVSVATMLYIFLFTDWKELIKDFMVIMFTNEGLKPFFLTKLFGNKSTGRKLNFVRDLIDDAFDKAAKFKDNPDPNAYENYINNEVSGAISKFLKDIINAFFGKLFSLESVLNKDWVGVDKNIYDKFRHCKSSGLCSYEDINLITKKVIRNVQNELAVINKGYIFAEPSESNLFNLESEENKKVINVILNSKSYEGFIENLRLNDDSINGNPELILKWDRAIYQQYKEVLSFYKEYSDYNTAIVKSLSSHFKTGENIGFQYRLYSYNFRNKVSGNKLSSFLQEYLIKPCPEGQILYFFTENDEPKFNCLDFSDINIETFDNKQSNYDEEYYTSYNIYASDISKKNIEILNLFTKASGVICNNDEYCSDISKDYSNFVAQKSQEFDKLLLETNTDVEKINIFIKNYISELKVHLVDLTKIYHGKEKELLNEINKKDTEIAGITAQLKDKTDENERLLLEKQIQDIREQRQLLENKYDYFTTYIQKIENPQTGLKSDITDAEAIGEISTHEKINNDFIIEELSKPDITPEYFAFLYCKLFSISEENVDILTLYEFFSSDKKELTDLQSKISNKKYYEPNSEVINSKLVEVGGSYRSAILQHLKVYLSKNQKEQYLYTGNFDEGYYIKKNNGEKKKITDGFQVFEEKFSEIKPHDKGEEENKRDLQAIENLKAKQQKRTERRKRKLEEILLHASEDTKAVNQKYTEKEKKEKAIADKLQEIRVEDIKYENAFKESVQDAKKKKDQLETDELAAAEAYSSAREELNKLAKSYDDDNYKEAIKKWADKTAASEKEYKNLIHYLYQYNKDLYTIAEQDYSVKRDDVKKSLTDTLETIKKLDKEMDELDTDDDTDEKFQELLDLWAKNLVIKDKYETFLNKSLQDQVYDIRSLQSQYYDENKEITDYPKYIDENGKPISLEQVKEKEGKIWEDLYSIPAYIQSWREYLGAKVKTFLKGLGRPFGWWGDNEETKEAKYSAAYKKVDETQQKVQKIQQEKKRLEQQIGKMEGGLNNFIRDVLHEDKRGYLKGYLYNYDEKLTEEHIKIYYEGTDKNKLPPEYYHIPFTQEMRDLREQLQQMRKQLTIIEDEIKTAEAKLGTDGKEAIKTRQKLDNDINVRDKEINKEEKRLIANEEERKKRYIELLARMEQTDKSELKDFNHKFGYSIKMSADGKISLQKTSNNLDDHWDAKASSLLTIFNDPSKIQEFYGGTLFGQSKANKLGLGKDSNGQQLPLNDKKQIISDKIKDGFPPIVFGSDIMDTVDLDLEVNIYDLDFLENLSKQKIKKIMQDYYTKIEVEGGEPIWIMNTQIKLWEDTFEDFNLKNFSDALQKGLKEKQENNKKDYTWSKTEDDGRLVSIKPSEQDIDDVFGVYFNYFDSLKIRGVEKPHLKEQGSIEAIRGEEVKNGKTELLQIIPLNIYQPTLNNYAIDFEAVKDANNPEEYHPFEFFFAGRVRLTK